MDGPTDGQTFIYRDARTNLKTTDTVDNVFPRIDGMAIGYTVFSDASASRLFNIDVYIDL